MARSYQYCGTAVNTVSSTLPLATIISTANIRPRIFEIQLSSDTAPNDQSVKLALQRCTTAGTPGSTPTSVALDPNDPAGQATLGLAIFSVGPTLTANSFPWQAAVYLRATYRWACKDGKEIVLPATASNGVGLISQTLNGAAYNTIFGFAFEE